MINRKNHIFRTLTWAALLCGSFSASALPNVSGKPAAPPPTAKGSLKGTAALCDAATANIDLDINNVRARLMDGGDMWWNQGTSTAAYEVPKGSGKSSLFAGSIWVGGYDEQGNLKVCAQTYRQGGQNDYWPGPLDRTTNTIDKATCSEWDKFWKVNKSDLLAFNELYKASSGVPSDDPKYDAINQWPAAGNKKAIGKSGAQLSLLQNGPVGQSYAPFIDANGDGLYNTDDGDYPDINGDQYIWWVFNDAGNAKTETNTGSIGMEVQTSAFAYSTKNYMNDATFYNYRLINRGTLNLTSTYMATWTDADLGYAYDDYIGCDTSRGLGVLYNAKVPDGNGEVTSYGAQVPMVGVDFFIGPKLDTIINGVVTVLDTLDMTVFNYFDNDNTPTGNPNGGFEIYRIMTGYNRQGAHLHNDFAAGPGSTGYGTGELTNFAYFGSPRAGDNEWSQCTCGLTQKDRRFVHSSGPFTLHSGGITNDVTIGVVWVSDVGGCPNATFSRIRAADDLAQGLFNDKFKTIEGPHAPDMTVREADRSLIFYLTNDNPASNNYHEKYGYDTARQYHESTSLMRNFPDSLYKFEGYRVFQLKNSSITAAQIFNQNGEVDNSLAVEVFQTDIKNNVTSIVNYTKNPDKGLNIYDAAVKVTGKDSGIVHSFRLTNDAFAKGQDSRFVNYHNYYFIAISYAYNNFKEFSYSNTDSTQATPYLESSKGAGSKNNPVIAAMPNPSNGNTGTYDSAKFGEGVVIKRLEGIGNGTNAISMDDSSETVALLNNVVPFTTYKQGEGPVDIRVIDPRMIKPYNWELYLTGTLLSDTARGLNGATSGWTLVGTNPETGSQDTIYSQDNISAANEQILAKYGLSVNIKQVVRPGEDQVNRDGYITSSVTFADPGKLWLFGVNDGENTSYTNWIRSGKSTDTSTRCNWKDNSKDTVGQFYETLFSNTPLLRGTWAPYALTATELRGQCGFGVAYNSASQGSLYNLPSIDVVFTSDKSKWTRTAVIELQDDPSLSDGKQVKFSLRRHASWNLGIDNNGNAAYATDPQDTGMSWFPGYAINQSTGERLNIIFGEDSYLKSENGADMIWNPSSNIIDPATGNVLFAGKHYIYVLSSRYDKDSQFIKLLSGSSFQKNSAYSAAQWVGLPAVTPGYKLLSLQDGLIPTETRLRFRIEAPYKKYVPVADMQLRNGGLPLYSFSTTNIAPKPLTDANNPYYNDHQALLDRIRVVPNPYYGYTGYEKNRLDTRVRITNLPNRATINIYSLDGTLIRRIEHISNTDNSQGFEDWDIRNAKGLQIASGMYMIHVQAEGMGETIIKWFGAMRPVDITTY